MDYRRRGRVAPNHTMTHVLNYALRKVVGGNPDQKGSLVNDEKLRFDFSHTAALTVEQVWRRKRGTSLLACCVTRVSIGSLDSQVVDQYSINYRSQA